jgi:hypothetical protein
MHPLPVNRKGMKGWAAPLSRDIGMTDTCPHGCPYCYSTMNPEIALRRYKAHDPGSTALIGSPEPSEKDTSLMQHSLV